MSNGTSVYWGTGVSNAIKALDASYTGATNKTLTTLTQADGKITVATFLDIAINESQVTWTNGKIYPLGDDIYIGDINQAGHLGLKSHQAGNTGLAFIKQATANNTDITAPSGTTIGKITWDGGKFILTGTTPTLGTSDVGSNKLPVYIEDGVVKAVTAKDTANNLINALETGSSDLTANDYVITQYVGGGTTTATYHRRPAKNVINKTLVDTALGASNTANFYRGDKAWSNTLKQTANAALGIDSNNKIGTARKDLNFDIASGSGTGVNDGYAGGITWGSGTSAYAGIYYQNSGSYGSRLLFGTTGSFANGAYARMIITHDGKVGIGTVSPDTLLTVNGDTNIKGTTDSTNTTTGAVKIAGGLGVAKNVWALKYNNLTLTAATTGFTIAGGTTSKTLTVSESVTLKGGSANYLAYYSTANNIQGHGLAHFSDTYSSSTKNGKNELVLGNSTASTTNGSAYGQLALYSGSTAGTYLKAADGSSWHTATLQADNGIIAYTDDITAAINALNVNEKGAINGTKYICAISESAGKINATVSAADIGSSHEPIYVDGGTIKQVIGQTIEYIVGTQTATTNNWTGVTADSSLYVGKMIAYKLPTAGNSSAAKLTLTLADGTTTAAINLRRQNGNVTTHYPAGSVIFLTYDGTYWQTDGDYDSNSNDTGYYIRYSSGTFTAVTALPRYKVLLQYNETSMLPVNTTDSSANTKETITTDQFLIFGDYAYFSTNGSVAANAAIAVGATWLQYQFDLRYSFNTGSTLTAQKDVYLVATPEPDGIHAKLRNPGATGTDASAAATGANAGPITQSLPTSDDGFIYIRLGRAYSTTNIVLTHSHPVYWYKDGSVKQYAPPVTSVALTTTVNSVAYYTDTTGTLGMKSSANGALYATSANGALQWGTLPVGQGGTGATAHTANRIVRASSTTKIEAAGTHYFDGSKLALNSTTAPTEVLYVNGASKFIGESHFEDNIHWKANKNIYCDGVAANSAEWSFDLTSGTYTGTYWQVWSGKNSNTIIAAYNDNRHVNIPVHLYVGGYNNTTYTLSTQSFICNEWIRNTGSHGWYNETYGGGIYMTDSTWIRTYGGKYFYCDSVIQGGSLISEDTTRSLHGFYSHRATAGGGTAGYFRFLHLDVNGGYADATIMIAYGGRSSNGGILTIAFSVGADNTSATLNYFENTGEYNFYAKKSTSNGFDFYAGKAGGWDQTTFTIINTGGLHMGIAVTWVDETVTSLPSGYQSAAKRLKIGGYFNQSNSDSTLIYNGSIELFSSAPYIDFHHGNSTADYTCRIASASDGLQIYRPSGITWINMGSNGAQAGIYFNQIGRGLISDGTGGGCLMTYHSGDGNCPIMAAGSQTSSERHWSSAFIAREGNRANEGNGTVWHCPRIALVWNGRAAITLELHASVTGLYVMRSPQTDGTRAQVYAAGFQSGSGNDYAEERDSLVLQPGKVVTETAVGKMVLADERLLPACRVVSDTYGMSVGQRDNNEFRAPIAVSGRVLVYPYRDRTEYPLGAAVCSAPNGTVDIMTREEIMMYPERIIGTVSEIPNYEVWNGSGIMGDIDSNVLVDGRIWVYVR